MIRAKITPDVVGGAIVLKIEWIQVIDNHPGKVLFTEEIKFGGKCVSYVSQVEFEHGQARPGGFGLDEEGLRHFVTRAEAGTIPLTGKGL